MTVIITLQFETSEIGLERPLRQFPESRLESERTTSSAHREGPLPYLWARSSRVDQFVDALADDPAIAELTLLDRYENRALCRTHWASPVERRLSSLLDVVRDADGTALRIRARDTVWNVRVRFDDRRALNGLPLEDFRTRPSVGQIRDARDDERGLLTDQQHETLSDAYESGYFDLPRRTSISDMADSADISLNAASERLRRATHSVVEWYMSGPTRSEFTDDEPGGHEDDGKTAGSPRN